MLSRIWHFVNYPSEFISGIEIIYYFMSWCSLVDHIKDSIQLHNIVSSNYVIIEYSAVQLIVSRGCISFTSFYKKNMENKLYSKSSNHNIYHIIFSLRSTSVIAHTHFLHPPNTSIP